jgi:allantoate deiminase
MDLAALTSEVLRRCDQLGSLTDEPGRLTRTYLSPATRSAHALLSDWMEEAGLRVRTDAVGNLIGRRDGRSADSRVFVVGSHLDTVPNAGKYDGALGVLLGVAALAALKAYGSDKNVDVVAFSEEEGIRYGRPFIGSRALVGDFEFDLLEKTDAAGITLRQAIVDFGLDPAGISEAAYAPGAVAGYLEAHIEQGPILDTLRRPLGIVDAIIGQSRCWITFAGMAGHAGTMPMELRRDALAAAAEFTTFVETTARSTLGLRATVGCLQVQPGAINVVPGFARLSLDVRHAQNAIRQRAVRELLERAIAIAAERDLEIDITPLTEQPATPCDPELSARLGKAIVEVGAADQRLVSGAGHDAMILARVCPIAMLFIRSPGGVSHHPEERVHPEDVQLALEAIIRFLLAELQEPP